jgi:predicted Rossmann-fold nucleotide-binding protein
MLIIRLTPGIHNRSIVLFNFQGFYDNLLTWIEYTTISGFASRAGADAIVVVDTLEELREFLSTESRTTADRSVGDMSSLTTGQGKIHARWENARVQGDWTTVF